MSDTTTILILTANPLDSSPLRLSEEMREIQESLQRSRWRERFALHQHWATRPRDIQRALQDFRPAIVQFSGHGEGEDGLLFESDDGQAKPVDSEALSELFKLFAGEIQCVLLNACYSEVQAQAIVRHIPYVIGMRQAIGDQAAREFSVAFYGAIGEGRDVAFAFEAGRVALRLDSSADARVPVLLRRLDGEQRAQLADQARSLEARHDYPKALERWEQLRAASPEDSQAGQSIERLREKISQNQRLQQLNQQLIKRMAEIGPQFYRKIGVDLKRIQDTGLTPEAEVMLDVLEQFLANSLDADTFKAFWESQPELQPAQAGIDLNYPSLAHGLAQGDIALFLGLDMAESPPGSQDFCSELRRLANYPHFGNSLAEVCEYFQINSQYGGRRALLADVARLAQAESHADIPLHRLLAGISKPLLLIVAGYDSLLEDAFRRQNKPFVRVTHPHLYESRGAVSLNLDYSDRAESETCLAERFSEYDVLERGYSLIYRIRGHLGLPKKDCLLLSEQDYLAFAKYVDELLPDYLTNQLNERGFWFLGHYPRTWEDRLLVSVLMERRNHARGTLQALAIHKDADEFARAFWKYHRVEVYDVALQSFVDRLR